MNNTLSNLYVEAMSLSDRERLPLHRSEYRTIGFTHSESGRLRAKVWRLGDEIHDALAYHHACEHYDGDYLNIVYTVAVANYFANSFEIGFSGNRYPEPVPDEVFSHLGITMDWLEDTEDAVNQEIEKARIFLRLAE